MTALTASQATTPEGAHAAPEALAQVQMTYEPAPADAPKDAPRVFVVVNSVMKDTMPVGKNQENKAQSYYFRGIDDVMSAMAGPMRAHGLLILPTIASHRQERRGERVTHTVIRMRYRIYGPAGDCLVADVPGEASDFADKGTNKAQSAALKYLLFTLFMLPVDGRSIDDGDREHPVEPPAEHRAERQQRGQQRQQRGQQRGQQRQQPQREQQPRRNTRAESGPQEQQGPPQQQRRDYLAEAQQATSREAFDKVRAAAVAAQAPAGYLARLDAVAAQKAQAGANAQQAPGPRAVPQQQQPQRNGTTFVDPSVVVERPQQQAPAVDPEHAAALGEMYDAAKSAQLADSREADTLFASQFGCQPAKGTPEQLRTMRDDLLEAAAGIAPKGVAA